MLQGKALLIALGLEDCGADANQYILTDKHRGDSDVIEIPAALADDLHALVLSLIPRPRGRPPNPLTEVARQYMEHKGWSKRKTARLIAKAAKENPESIRRRLRATKPCPPKPRK
jgi:hypothetical protein